MPPVALFTYGTLMLDEIMTLVTGRIFPSQDGILADFRRFRLRGEVYPGICPEAGAETRGRLYLGLDGETLHRLDAFEGEQYRRQTVTVTTAEGREYRAETYLLAPRGFALRTGEAWEPAWFIANHLHTFRKECEIFRQTMGQG